MATAPAKTPTKKSVEGPPSAVAARDPFTSWREEMNDLLARIWNGPEERIGFFATRPALDVAETENAFEVRLDIPGMDANDFDIQVQGNVITLSGKREEKKEEKEKTYHRIERRSGSFSRTVTLPCDVNEDEVAAEYTNGVLTVTLPKTEKSRAKRIVVKQ